MTENLSRPRPFRSVLRPYLDEIRRMRRARHTWKEIAEHLAATRGIQIAPPSVYLFFKRAIRRKTLPLGFEDLPVDVEASNMPANPKSLRTQSDEHPEQRRSGSEPVSVMPINHRKKSAWFGSWEPEQGINYTPKDK
jgi:hypothetical protein